MSVNFQQTARPYIIEDGTLHRVLVASAVYETVCFCEILQNVNTLSGRIQFLNIKAGGTQDQSVF